MFESRKELTAKLEAFEADIARLETELGEATKLVDAAAVQTQGVAELIEELESVKADLKDEEDAHAETKAELEAEQAKTTPEAIQALVTAEIAGSCHPAIENPTAEIEERDTAKIQEQFNSMSSGPERTEFFNQNKDILSVL